MLHIKLLLAACLGTFVYVCMSVTFGRNGIWVYRQLESQKKIITTQTELIQKLNTELVLEHTALLKDRDVIAAYARRLDYVASDEKLVKITGLKPFQRTLYNTGTALKHTDVDYLSEDICKSAGFLFFAATLVIMLMVDAAYGARAALKARKEFSQGIPIYDMPQVR
ncbi:MAG: FtsB family cell division protein [Treponema sp.]